MSTAEELGPSFSSGGPQPAPEVDWEQLCGRARAPLLAAASCYFRLPLLLASHFIISRCGPGGVPGMTLPSLAACILPSAAPAPAGSGGSTGTFVVLGAAQPQPCGPHDLGAGCWRSKPPLVNHHHWIYGAERGEGQSPWVTPWVPVAADPLPCLALQRGEAWAGPCVCGVTAAPCPARAVLRGASLSPSPSLGLGPAPPQRAGSVPS